MWKSFISSISGLLQPLGTMLGIRAFGGKNAFNSWMKAQTQSGLTGQQIEANQMQMQNWREQTQSQYGLQVQGMQDAGLNPALMYQNGVGSAPGGMSAPTQGSAMSFSDLAQMMLVDKQSKLLEAEIRNKDADTDKKSAETENMKLVNQYYPAVTQSQIQKTLTAMGVDDALVQKYLTEVDATEMDIALKEISQVIEQAKADNSSAYYKALADYEAESVGKVKAEKAEIMVREAMETIEKNYMEKYDVKMGSSEYIAIASCICQLLGGDLSEILSYFKKNPFVGITEDMANKAKARKGKGGQISPTTSQDGPKGNSR